MSRNFQPSFNFVAIKKKRAQKMLEQRNKRRAKLLANRRKGKKSSFEEVVGKEEYKEIQKEDKDFFQNLETDFSQKEDFEFSEMELNDFDVEFTEQDFEEDSDILMSQKKFQRKLLGNGKRKRRITFSKMSSFLPVIDEAGEKSDTDSEKTISIGELTPKKSSKEEIVESDEESDKESPDKNNYFFKWQEDIEMMGGMSIPKKEEEKIRKEKQKSWEQYQEDKKKKSKKSKLQRLGCQINFNFNF